MRLRLGLYRRDFVHSARAVLGWYSSIIMMLLGSVLGAAAVAMPAPAAMKAACESAGLKAGCTPRDLLDAQHNSTGFPFSPNYPPVGP